MERLTEPKRCECGEPIESWAHQCYDCGQRERREEMSAVECVDRIQDDPED